MRVVIRTDSSTDIGSGHVMRCLTLAKQLQKKQEADVVFVMRDLPGNLINLVEREGFQVFVLPRAEQNISLCGYEQWLTVPVVQDAQETLEMLQRHFHTVDRLVVDSYALDYRWEQALRVIAKQIIGIDDLANRKHDCDILLDQNFYRNKDYRYDGLVPKHCQLLLGPEHALLRDEFYEVKKHIRKRDGKIRKILVFYGGSDLTNETSKAITALLSVHEKVQNNAGTESSNIQADFTVDVIVGLSNPHRQEIEMLCSQYDYINYYCQVSNMAEFMNEADLMLGAGGSTTWERLYLQLPAIVTAIADNQVEICRDCAEAGMIKFLGLYESVSVEDIKQSILTSCN